MRVVGRSGAVMDLPEQLARALMRDGSVWPADEEVPAGQPAPPAPPSPPDEVEVPVVDYAATGRTTTPLPDNATVRAWAQKNDVDCPAKGKIPQRVLDAYRAAHPEGG